jgi:hypothetical protein
MRIFFAFLNFIRKAKVAIDATKTFLRFIEFNVGGSTDYATL